MGCTHLERECNGSDTVDQQVEPEELGRRERRGLREHAADDADQRGDQAGGELVLDEPAGYVLDMLAPHHHLRQ